MGEETGKRSYSISFAKFVTIALICYFGFVIFNANDKLQSRRIGTTFQTIRMRNVQDSYISVVFSAALYSAPPQDAPQEMD